MFGLTKLSKAIEAVTGSLYRLAGTIDSWSDTLAAQLPAREEPQALTNGEATGQTEPAGRIRKTRA